MAVYVPVLQIGDGLRNLLLGNIRFVLDEIVFHANFLRGLDDACHIKLALARDDVIRGASMRWISVLAHVLDVEQIKAFGVGEKQLGRINLGRSYPKNIRFKLDVLRIGLVQEQVEQRAVAGRAKFVSMGVIEELNVMFGGDLARVIKNRGGFVDLGFVKRILVRNPGATGVGQT